MNDTRGQIWVTMKYPKTCASFSLPPLISPQRFLLSKAQKRESMCVSMLRVSGSKRRWDVTSSFILPSALALWGRALCLSHLHSTILFCSHFSVCHRWEQDTTGNEREQALIREGGLGQRDWNNKTFKTGSSNLGGLEARLNGSRFLFSLYQRATRTFSTIVSPFFFRRMQRWRENAISVHVTRAYRGRSEPDAFSGQSATCEKDLLRKRLCLSPSPSGQLLFTPKFYKAS